MGRHLAAGRRRGVAGWPLLVLAVVVLLVAGTLVYFAVLHKSNRADNGCTGSVTLPVLAATGSSPAARAMSDAFNATSPSAHSNCLTTIVVTSSSADAEKALAANWAGESGSAPGVWITDDGSALATVEQKVPSLTAGRDPAPIATSPVVLAMKSADATKLRGVSWSTLGAGDPAKLSLPDPGSNRASAYAIESMIANADSSPTMADIKAAARQLKGLNASLSDAATTGEALDQVAGSPQPDAVPVTEADLGSYNGSASKPLTAVYPKGPTAGDDVFVVSLAGSWMTPTLVDAATRFHAFARSADGAKVLAAAHLRVPGTTTPTATGIQPATSVTPLPAAAAEVPAAIAAAIGPQAAPSTGPIPTTAGTPAASSPMPTTTTAATAATTTTATATATNPTVGPTTSPATSKRSVAPTPVVSTASSGTGTAATSTSPTVTTQAAGVTFLIDTASTWSMTVNGKSRTDWLKQALTAVMAKPATGSIGLWSVSSSDGASGYRVLVPTGPLTGAVNGTTRSAALTAAISGLPAAGSRRTYQALPVALTAAAKNSSGAHPQLVILVTDGPDQTPSTPRDAVLGQLRTIATNNPNVHLEVLGVGGAAPDDALRAIAAAGNGGYTDVQHPPDLPAALLSVFAGG